MLRITAIALALVAVFGGAVYWLSDDAAPERDTPGTPDDPGSPDSAPAKVAPISEKPKEPCSTISGDVLAETGEPGRDAKIRAVALDPHSWPRPGEAVLTATADGRGRFRVEDVPPGLYRVEARTEGSCGYVPVVRVRKEFDTRVMIRLEALATITGWVLAEDSSAVAGVTVSADLGGVNRTVMDTLGLPALPLTDVIETKTDAAGAFRLENLPRGQYEIQIDAPRHLQGRIPAVNAPVDGIEIRLISTYEVDGRVRGLWGKGPHTVMIVAQPSGSTLALKLKEKEKEASFTLSGLTRGRHLIRAFVDDGRMAEAEVTIEAGRRPERVDLVLSGNRVLKGEVGPSDRYPAGTTLVFYRAERPRYPRNWHIPLVEYLAVPIAKGNRYQALLPKGYWVARLRIPGHAELVTDREPRREIFERERGKDRRDFDFTSRGFIQGRVIYEDGWPAGGVMVSVSLQNKSTETDVGGRFRLLDLTYGMTHALSAWDGAGRVVEEVQLTRSTVSKKVLLRLPRLGTGIVRGQVISEENEPVAGATVLFEDGFAVSDVAGRFERRDVRPGRNQLRFYAVGYSMGISKRFQVKNGEVTEPKLLVLPWRAARVTGRVLDSRGDPVAGARVTVLFEEVGEELSTSTDATGRFLQEGPGAARGKAIITVTAQGYEPGKRGISLRPEVEEVDFRLGRARVSK